ncbi:MAG: dTMP kinase [Clostridia bacterium]
MRKGFFISVEGLDGSGKTTQIQSIDDYFRGIGMETIMIREPGGTEIGEKVRDILLDACNTGMDSVAEMLLFAASRAQIMAEKILPALNEGKVVICDRFIDSSIAYQGYGRGLDVEEVMAVNLAAVRHVLPDITFFLDKKPEESLRRRREATGADRLENERMEFHDRVYKGYKELCKKYPERIKKLDGDRDIASINGEIIGNIKYILGRM